MADSGLSQSKEALLGKEVALLLGQFCYERMELCYVDVDHAHFAGAGNVGFCRNLFSDPAFFSSAGTFGFLWKNVQKLPFEKSGKNVHSDNEGDAIDVAAVGGLFWPLLFI